MKNEQIRIIRQITYGDVKSGRVTPEQVMGAQVREWIFRPARTLADLRSLNPRDTDHGIALLSLLLLFFEPHGQYVTGQDSSGHSREVFGEGFLRFRQWLEKRPAAPQNLDQLHPDTVYKFARCGLLHSAQVKGEFLVDAVDFCSFPIERNRWFGTGWLINPWLLLPEMEKYFDEYAAALSKPSHKKDKVLCANFAATYSRLVDDVLKSYSRVTVPFPDPRD